LEEGHWDLPLKGLSCPYPLDLLPGLHEANIFSLPFYQDDLPDIETKEPADHESMSQNKSSLLSAVVRYFATARES
jgi:hypothetical protein